MLKRVFGATAAVLLLFDGYALAAQLVVMDIKGMTCELCPIAIKKSLEKVKGVTGVKISYEEKKARLAVEDAVTDKSLEEAVGKAGGYSGKVVERK